MIFCINEFRGFKRVDRTYVAPLTILVGENSAGKTSFLAALRYVMDLILSPENASFNREPFLLGAYDQIAHYRGGKFGRSSSFSFEIEVEAEIGLQHFSFGPDENNEGIGSIEKISCHLEFFNEFSTPCLCKIVLNSHHSSVSIERQENKTINVKIHFNEAGDEPESSASFMIDSSMVPGNLMTALENLTFVFMQDNALKSKKKGIDFKLLRKVDSVSARLKALRGQLRSEIYASAPVRTEPGRAYTPLDIKPSPQGSHVPYMLAKLKRHDSAEWEKLKSKIDEFGQNSGLFNKIDVKNLGRSESDPFQIYFDFGGPKRNIIDIGYGVSQILPLIASVMSTDVRTQYLFQQPEVHLHPQAQAALGTFLCTETARGRHSFIIESHSDFIIDRIRMAIRDKKLETSQVSVLYFHKTRLDSKITRINIDEHGNIVDAPPSYRRFFLDEAMRSLG